MVRANVRAKLYSGTTDVLTATITGAERPQEEIVVYSHIYECQIDDNATSAAAAVEMVRVTRALMDEGVIPRPKRTIRFVLGWEWIGSTWWALNQRAGRKWLASLCIDGFAHRQEQTRQPVYVSTSPTMAASFADALFVDTWKKAFRPLPMKAWRTIGWTVGTDTYWVDPQLGGVSNIYPHQGTGPTWHKSHTNVGDIDREVAHASSAACLTWMLAIAGAGPKEAEVFARLAAERVERKIRRYAAGFDFSRHAVDGAREQFFTELACLEGCAAATIDTTHLAPEDAALARSAGAARARVTAAAAEVREQAEAAFAAARAALPEWEAARPEDLLRDRDERVADNLVPTRLVPGYLWSLHRLSDADRVESQRLGRVDPLCLFLADGKRTLLDIARLRAFEQGPIPLRNLVRQYRLLAAAGYVKLAARRTFTADGLLKDLRAMGSGEGDTLLVHSSLFGLGPLEGGAEAIFEALRRAVGEKGTVCMPAFAHGTLDRPVYDPAQSRSATGELTNLFWRRPGVLRSRHPSHGLAAQGARAEWIVRDNEQFEPYDIRGAFGRLYQLDAKIFFLGSGLQCNSTLHAVEDWAEMPSMQPATYHYLDAGGQRVQVEYRKEPQHWREFYSTTVSVYERLFRQKGIVREGSVGLARSFLMRSRDVMEFGLELLRKRAFEFLLGKGVRDPDIRQIEARLTDWKFPEGIWDQMKALREAPPG
jgi:aminoglycoside N3'-acetyltransferase